MKAVLEFNLPDERYEFDNAIRGGDWRSVAEAALKHLREILKYGDPPTEVVDTLEAMRKEMLDNLEYYGLHAEY